MAKYYRGDTLPVVASWDGYTIQAGDEITGALLTRETEEDEYKILQELKVTATETADEVQLEFSRELMHEVEGDIVIEVRIVTIGDVEMTVQKIIDLRKDGIR